MSTGETLFWIVVLIIILVIGFSTNPFLYAPDWIILTIFGLVVFAFGLFVGILFYERKTK